MQVKKYEELVIRLESQALPNYRRFRWRVCAYMAWGYFLMGFLFFLIVGFALALLFTRMIGLAARYLRFGSAFGDGLVKGLRIKLEPSKNYRIERFGAEPLFEMIDQICKELKAPRIDSVYLIRECNAYALQRPKWGHLKSQNEVGVGLPLLALMDLEELRGVVAHEIGHIHRGHSRFGRRVSQVSAAWEGALRESMAKGMKAGTLSKIIDLYQPWLSAASVVLSRMAEREANLAEASVVGEECSGRISVALAIFTPEADEVWDKTTRDTFALPGMCPDLATRYYHALKEPIDPAVLEGWLVKSLQQPDDPFSSHPNLTRLLEACNIAPTTANALRLAGPTQVPRQSAAEAIFGSNLDTFLAKIDHHWETMFAKSWTQQRQRYVETAGKVAELLETARQMPPTDNERVELSTRLFNLGRPEEASKWLLGLEDRDPPARFLNALILKALQNPDWVPQMERMLDETEFEVQASQCLIAHFNQLGDRLSTQRLYDRLQAIQKDEEDAALNRNTLAGPWVYGQCGWDARRRAGVADALAQHKDIARDYLVDRSTKSGRRRHTVLVLQRILITATDATTLLKRVVGNDGRLTGALVFAIDKVPGELQKIPGALVYDPKVKPTLQSA